MKKPLLLASVLLPLFALALAAADPAESRVFELRTYYAAPGKFDALNARFRDHTLKLFAKHGMTNIAYWVPVENPENKLIYLLAHASPAAADQSWKNFSADPDWKQVVAKTQADGKLADKIERVYLKPTDYSPRVEATKDGTRTFEMRTYTAAPGKLDALNARFRDHTLKLFTKHGITNFGYFVPAAGQKGEADTLVYFLIHKNPEAAKSSFDAFRADPAWKDARAASEQKAGGSLTVKDGVKSVFLKPTDYSPAQ